jgi:hypothetical protein
MNTHATTVAVARRAAFMFFCIAFSFPYGCALPGLRFAVDLKLGGDYRKKGDLLNLR